MKRVDVMDKLESTERRLERSEGEPEREGHNVVHRDLHGQCGMLCDRTIFTR